MVTYAQDQLVTLIDICCDASASDQIHGKALEDLICFLIDPVPGVVGTDRNATNRFRSEEVDVCVGYRPHPSGFALMPPLFLVECKNWSSAADVHVITHFKSQLENRSMDVGVLVAASGLTGDPQQLTAAHNQVQLALAQGLRIVVITMEDLKVLNSTEDFVALLDRRYIGLHAAGTVNLN